MNCAVSIALLLGLITPLPHGPVSRPAMTQFRADQSSHESSPASTASQANTQPSNEPASSQTPNVPPNPESKESSGSSTTEQRNSTSERPSGTHQSSKSKTKSRNKATAKAGTSKASKKRVVRNGSAPDPELEFVPGVSGEQAKRQLQYSKQLLNGTDANLKIIASRQLRPGDQDQISRIRSYMSQAKAALDAGDLQRGQTLAYKANLLSKELLGR